MKNKKYACKNCKKISSIIGVSQVETHYYSVDLETGQWEDFNGSETVESQEYFCVNCDSKISTEVADRLID